MATEQKSMTLNELRVVLSDNIRNVQAGSTAPASANAITTAVGTLLRSVKLEMEYFRLTGKTPNIPLLDASMNEELKKAA
jgi:hypothetical protein